MPGVAGMHPTVQGFEVRLEGAGRPEKVNA
jgi:hypothetical protein